MTLAPRPLSHAPPIVFHQVWKRYRRGLQHYSLRDAIPALIGRLVRRAPQPALEEGEFWALRDVSFQVAQGETLGIIGRNGAGKSTALKLLSGITQQTQGQVQVRGRLAALIEVGAGFHPDLTGRENVFLNGAILGLKRHEIRALFDEIVAFSELEAFIDTPVKRYSSGMFMRLGFAVAAHVNPEVLLIDEVLAVGDLAFQQKCMQRIHELKRMGKTIVFISHNLNAVQRICDRALLLTNGEVAADGNVADVIRAYRNDVLERQRRRFDRSITGQAAAVRSAPVVHIEAVELRNHLQQPTDTIETGQPLSVDVHYACAQRIERPIVTVSIERLDGLVCHLASTHHQAQALPALEGRGRLRVTYPDLSLLPNTYGVSIEVTEEGRATPLESRKFAAMFTMTCQDHDVGVMRMAHAWHLLPPDGAAPLPGEESA